MSQVGGVVPCGMSTCSYRWPSSPRPWPSRQRPCRFRKFRRRRRQRRYRRRKIACSARRVLLPPRSLCSFKQRDLPKDAGDNSLARDGPSWSTLSSPCSWGRYSCRRLCRNQKGLTPILIINTGRHLRLVLGLLESARVSSSRMQPYARV